MGSKNPPPDERVVYLAMKNVFRGQDAEIRKTKLIKQHIQRNANQDSIASLVREHNMDILCNSVQNLLTRGVFASTLEAKIRFPELFDPSPDQTAEKEASEAEAARHEADAIQQIVKAERGVPNDDAATEQAAVEEKGKELESPQLEITPAKIPQLFPVYLPFPAQHQIAVHLQQALEAACFKYGERRMPEVLKQRGWDCPQAVELTRWTEVLSKRVQDSGKMGHRGRNMVDVLRSIANIRHTAVHRLRVTAKAIEQFVLDAEVLLAYLEDDEHAKAAAKLRRTVQTTLEDLERNKYFLRSRLEETLEKITEQRAELQRLERAAVEEMTTEDEEYQAMAGRILEQVFGTPVGPARRESSEGSFSTALNTENELTEVDGGDMDDEI